MKSAILILILTSMVAACAVEPSDTDHPNPSTRTAEESLICDPNCDPGGQQSVVVALYNEGGSLGTQTGGTICHHYSGGYDPDGTFHPEHDECTGIWTDPWTQQYLVWCSSLGSCDHRACGWPNDPTQWACR